MKELNVASQRLNLSCGLSLIHVGVLTSIQGLLINSEEINMDCQ